MTDLTELPAPKYLSSFVESHISNDDAEVLEGHVKDIGIIRRKFATKIFYYNRFVDHVTEKVTKTEFKRIENIRKRKRDEEKKSKSGHLMFKKLKFEEVE